MNRAAALALLGVPLLAAAQTPSPAVGPAKYSEAEAQVGRIIYARYCATCHGVAGKGDGVLAGQLVKRPIDLTQLAKKNKGEFPFDKVAASIDGRNTPRAHGTSDMPAWGQVFSLTDGSESPDPETAVKRVTHFVWSLQPKLEMPDKDAEKK